MFYHKCYVITLSSLNQNYIYTADGALDSWTIIEPVDGKYKGDCEDYVLTLQSKVEGFDRLELYFCKYNGEGHCIGKLDGQWIDCGLQRLVATLPTLYTDVRKYWWIEIVTKKLIGKVLRWYKNL